VSFTLGCYHRGGCSAQLTEGDGEPEDKTIADIMNRKGWTWAGSLPDCPEHTRKGNTMASKRKTKGKSEGVPFTEGANPRPKGQQETIHREKHRKPYTRELPVDANEAEVAKMAHELAGLNIQLGIIKSAKRESNAKFREKIASIDDQTKKLSECVQSNRKLVQVRVQEFMLATGEIEIVRVDSGEVVDRRVADNEDRQRDIEDGLED
jgi:hypothetical protein